MVSARILLVLTATACALATPFKRDATTVENDIRNNIIPQTNKLSTDVNAFPGSGLVGALGIHTDATTLNSSVSSATTDAKAAGTFSEADGQTVLGLLQTLVPTIVSTLTALDSKKAAFQALPISGIPALVLSDLQALNASTTNFGNALLANAPADLKPNGTALLSQVTQAFATAIATYSS